MRTIALLLVLATSALAGPVAPAVAPPAPAAAAKPKPLPLGIVQIEVEDLHCKTCARKLARKLYGVPGVLRVKADVKRDVATVTLQPKKRVAPKRLWEAALASGQEPAVLRFADQRLTAQDFPKAKPPASSVKHDPAE